MMDMAMMNKDIDKDMIASSKETDQLFKDVFDGKMPKRVPVGTSVDIAYAIQYAGYDLKEAQWNIPTISKVMDKAVKDLACDRAPCFMVRFPLFYEILGAKNFRMGADGFLQHPETHCMEPDEYDKLIEDPYKFVLETALPRIYSKLDTNSVERSLVFAKAFKMYYDYFIQLIIASEQICLSNGISTIPAVGSQATAPFDFVADQLRGFSGIAKDIRRMPEKIGQAAEAVLPMMLKIGIAHEPSKYKRTLIPLHMPPYIRMDTFEKHFWPSFKALVQGLDKAGMGVKCVLEENWMRYIDYLTELPENVTLMWEYGDPKTVKEKLGDKFIISGFYPLNILKHGTKEQCIDEAKKLIDICAPGGKFIFELDKLPVTLSDANPENLIALNNFIKEYAVY